MGRDERSSSIVRVDAVGAPPRALHPRSRVGASVPVMTFVRPGTDPLDEEDLAIDAVANMTKFANELGLDGVSIVADLEEPPSNGVFPFVLERGGRVVAIDMPGVPLPRIRWSHAEQPPEPFPLCVYVNGLDLVWPSAIPLVRKLLVEGSR